MRHTTRLSEKKVIVNLLCLFCSKALPKFDIYLFFLPHAAEVLSKAKLNVTTRLKVL